MRSNEQLLPAAPLSVAAGSLCSPAAFFMIAPQQNCGVRQQYVADVLARLTSVHADQDSFYDASEPRAVAALP